MKSALASFLVACLACSPNYDEMREALGQLTIPSDYVLISDENEGSFPGFFGDTPRVYQRYRSPRDFGSTCREALRVADPFLGPHGGRSVREGGHRPICSVWFEVEGFPVGLTVIGPLFEEAAEEFEPAENGFVYVDVKIRDEVVDRR